jgi:short-subunit dehydrogenase
MNLTDTRVVLTGASGGIGTQIATALTSAGARVLLVDRQAEMLRKVSARLGEAAAVTVADLTRDADRRAVVDAAEAEMGGVDILINNAGLLDFTPYEAENPHSIERLIAVNIVAPMLLTRTVLPRLLAQSRGRIVNIGSTFGSIGFPFFASYSASKFAIRGFSEALRRELEGTGVGVSYVAPRATCTPLNTSAVYRMNEELKVKMDKPEKVAAAVVEAIRKDRTEIYVGWPESLFARLNGLLPAIADHALRKQIQSMRKFAVEPEPR